MEWNVIDKYLQQQRINNTFNILKQYNISLNEKIVVDLGCGNNRFLESVSNVIRNGYGVDKYEYTSNEYHSNIKRIVNNFDSGDVELFKENSIDIVFMLASLEHLHNPNDIVKEIHRILRPGGVFIFTTPSPHTHGLLTVLSSLGIISKQEINDHKQYFTFTGLRNIIEYSGFSEYEIKSFQLTMNQIGIAYK